LIHERQERMAEENSSTGLPDVAPEERWSVEETPYYDPESNKIDHSCLVVKLQRLEEYNRRELVPVKTSWLERLQGAPTSVWELVPDTHWVTVDSMLTNGVSADEVFGTAIQISERVERRAAEQRKRNELIGIYPPKQLDIQGKANA
jgi:hypothetical protein